MLPWKIKVLGKIKAERKKEREREREGGRKGGRAKPKYFGELGILIHCCLGRQLGTHTAECVLLKSLARAIWCI